jgi:hypothetical protein
LVLARRRLSSGVRLAAATGPGARVTRPQEPDEDETTTSNARACADRLPEAHPAVDPDATDRGARREASLATDGAIAIVQASGDDYRGTLAAALRYADDPADLGTLINTSAELALFSAACDGAGQYSMQLLPAQAGQVPTEHGAHGSEPDTGLLVTARCTAYRLAARSYTRRDDSSCFARWLLIPQRPPT